MPQIIPITDYDFLNTFHFAGYSSKTSYRIDYHSDDTSCSFTMQKYLRPAPYHKEWQPFSSDRERISAILAQGLSFGMVENDSLIAICLLEHFCWNSTINIEQIEVIPAKRGFGLGSQMLNQVMQIAKTNKVRSVSLETQHTNGDAISFYQKNGFKIEGLDLSFYTNHDLATGEVAIFMKKQNPDKY